MEWISIDQKLPEEDTLVFIYFKRNLTPLVGMLSKEKPWFGYRKTAKWVDDECFLLDDNLITHWTPIIPPKN